MDTVRLACAAMATRFELVLHGPNPVALRAAGEEAIEEIHRLEALLSLYRPDSEIATLNREAHLRAVRVSPEVFRLIEHALLLSAGTGGAFDITVAPLLKAWGLMKDGGHVPTDEVLASARACVGRQWVELDAARSTVRFARTGVMLDLGSIGKGYALDRAAERLTEAGIEHALVHGGTSTVVALGHPPDTAAWRVAIDAPMGLLRGATDPAAPTLTVVELRDESLSVSAIWGKGFEADGRYFGHVMDPREGRPVTGALLAVMVLPSATESDALSTALLVRGRGMVEEFRKSSAPCRCLVAERADQAPGYALASHGAMNDVPKAGR